MPVHVSLLAAALVVAASACSSAPTATEPSGESLSASSTLLQGTWTSTEDPNSVVVFSGDTYTDIYAGETLDSAPYTLSDGCDGTEALVFAFTVALDGDPLCYSVSELTATRLEYMMAGGRGNTLMFTRAASAR